MSDPNTTYPEVLTTPTETNPNVPYYCRYLTTKGEQCRQIALNGRNFCYAHRDPEPDFGFRKIKVPLLEDSASIQLMLTKILHGLLNDHFPAAVASKAIYCCQVAASTIARPVAYRPKLGEKLPAEPMAVMEIYQDQQGNLMGPLEEYPLPAAPAEPESARAKARAEWDKCVAHHYWCPGPTAAYKCADCQRVAQLCSEPPKEEPTQEPTAVSPAPEPSKLSPTPDPIAMIADPVDEPSANSSSHDYELAELTAVADEPCCNRCSGHCAFPERCPLNAERCSSELTAAADEPCCNRCSGHCAFPERCPLNAERCSSELTAVADEPCCNRCSGHCAFPERCPDHCSLITGHCSDHCSLITDHGRECGPVVDLVKRPTNLIPNEIKTTPQGGTPHFQNKSTQKPHPTSSEQLPLLSLEEAATRYFAESELPDSLNAHLYPVPCTLYPAISSPLKQTPSTDQLSCRAESAPARSIQGGRRETASRGSLRRRDVRHGRSSSSSRQGRSK
jgi:hypothetical protein